jgi:hypothetical protein
VDCSVVGSPATWVAVTPRASLLWQPQACAKKELGLVKGSECAGEFWAGDRGEAWCCITNVQCQQRDHAALKSTGGTKTVAGYAQVTLVGVDLDHVTTSRYAPEAAEYGGTVTLRARSRGIDFTYTYPFSNRTSVLDAIDGATKSLLSELESLSRACMDVTRQERDATEGDQNTEGPGDDL